MIPRVLTNKTVLTGFEKSFLKGSMLFKPMFGDAGRMGKVLASAPALESNVIQGTFKADINAMLKTSPAGLGSPTLVLKTFVR